MCGIVGYVGPKPVVPILMEGLQRLEYRGYDSAGIAVVEDGALRIRRSAGKLARLGDVLEREPLHGQFGIGHTRWATHGRPTEENAHPHRDCRNRIVVVHNGIVENYLELKRELIAEGHAFLTETDTEIVAHLVERETRGDGLEAAVRRSLERLRGLFALVLISADEPDTIIAVRNGPPVVVGIGNDEYFVASDVPAILSHTRDVVFLDDQEIAVVTRTGVTFTDFAGNVRQRAPQRVNWDPVMAEKAGYRHFMLKEIHEQPWAVRETVLGRVSLESGRVFLEEIDQSILVGCERIVLLACGTSWHACLVGKFMIEQLARVPVDVDYASEFRYRHPVVDDKTLAVVVTQSGETADTLAALREAKQHGAPALAICNVVGSMVTRLVDGTIYTHAGPEIGVASTKAFTCQLVAFQLLALALAGARNTLSSDDMRRHLQGLEQLPLQLEKALEVDSVIDALSQRAQRHKDYFFFGRGPNYPIALEGALKLKELAYIHAHGYPAGEMKHGPIALLDEQMLVVALAPHDSVFEKSFSNIQEAKARGACVVVVTNPSKAATFDAILDKNTDYVLTVPEADELLNPVLLTIPLQFIAYYVAYRRGCDIDQPRNLAKSVTVE